MIPLFGVLSLFANERRARLAEERAVTIGAAPWTEQAIDEAIVAWCMEQVFVGHELRTLAPTLESNLAAVERLKFRPVGNADDGGCTELCRQKLHHFVLARGIKR